MTSPKITFVIATLNEIARLPRVIESIRAQRYPQELIEIIVADGGSTDGTQEYAASAGCIVIDNPVRRAEPGYALGCTIATGDLRSSLAADTILHTPDFVTNLVAPFADPEVYVAVPRVVSTGADCLATRYINEFTDPFNHFLYGDATSAVTFARKYPIKRATDEYIVYDFQASAPPLIGFAQGVTLRATLTRRAGTEEDDIRPIMDIVQQGLDIAYVPGALIEHHTVSSLPDFLRKFGPRIAKRLEDRTQPLWERAGSWTPRRRMRAHLWPFYAISVVGPVTRALYGVIRDRRAIWLYHPVITLALGIEFWRRALPYAFSVAARRLRGQRV